MISPAPNDSPPPPDDLGASAVDSAACAPSCGSVSPAARAALDLLYGELRTIAATQMRHERSDHTFQPTALVHEAFLRVCGREGIDWSNRSQVLAVAAATMRRILVDHARGAAGLKRGGAGRRGVAVPHRREALDVDRLEFSPLPPGEIVALDEALSALAEHDARMARIVELRYFAGLTVDETAAAVGISARTIDQDFRSAKAWLRCALER